MSLSRFTDHQLALMLDGLQDGKAGKRSSLIAEVAYRLIRAGGGEMKTNEGALIDIILTGYWRARNDARTKRRQARYAGDGRPEQRLPKKKPPARVIEMPVLLG